MTTRVWFWRLLSRMPSILFDSYKDILKLSVFRTWTFDLTDPCSQNSSRRYLTTQEPLEKNQFQVLLTWSALHMTWGHQWSVRGLIKNFSKLFLCWKYMKIVSGPFWYGSCPGNEVNSLGNNSDLIPTRYFTKNTILILYKRNEI